MILNIFKKIAAFYEFIDTLEYKLILVCHILFIYSIVNAKHTVLFDQIDGQ